jgi:hypothetical protein
MHSQSSQASFVARTQFIPLCAHLNIQPHLSFKLADHINRSALSSVFANHSPLFYKVLSSEFLKGIFLFQKGLSAPIVSTQ